MQYMLMFHETTDELSKRTDPLRAGDYRGAWKAYVGAMHAPGCVVSGAGLQPSATATTVRLSGGKRLAQDGAFACRARRHRGAAGSASRAIGLTETAALRRHLQQRRAALAGTSG